MENQDNKAPKEALVVSIIGLMCGDALGLPFEGIGPLRIQKWMIKPLRHQFFLGKGMVSDDSEHALITAAAMTRCWDDPKRFSKDLGWRLRWWLARVPAGTGMATARALIKLWLGFSPQRSGVFSAGNGPAMRAPIIGVATGHELEQMKRWIRDSTCLTHSDPKAVVGSVAVAYAAYVASTSETISASAYVESLKSLLSDEDEICAGEFLVIMDSLLKHLDEGDSVEEVAKAMNLGRGVTGYMYHTVPIVLYGWFQQKRFEDGMEDIIALGGDTDTTAAIFGGISGAQCGIKGIPQAWVSNIVDYPMSPNFAIGIVQQLDDKRNGKTVSLSLFNGPLLMIRNFIFLVIVLGHGFRRLLPPY